MWKWSDSRSGIRSLSISPSSWDLHLLGWLQYLTQGILNYFIYLRSYLILLTLTQRRDPSGQNKFQNIDLLLPYAVPDWRTGHGVGSCNPMQRKAVQCSGKQCNAMESNAMQWKAMQCDGKQCNAVECNAIQWDAMQYSGMRCSGVQCNAVLCDTMQGKARQWNDKPRRRKILKDDPILIMNSAQVHLNFL